MKGVYFIVLPSTAPLSYKKPATAGISLDSRSAENSVKGNTLYSYFVSCLYRVTHGNLKSLKEIVLSCFSSKFTFIYTKIKV